MLKVEPFLIERKGRDEGCFRLREEHEQKCRDMNVYVPLKDITLEGGDQLDAKRQKSISGQRNSIGEGWCT